MRTSIKRNKLNCQEHEERHTKLKCKLLAVPLNRHSTCLPDGSQAPALQPSSPGAPAAPSRGQGRAADAPPPPRTPVTAQQAGTRTSTRTRQARPDAPPARPLLPRHSGTPRARPECGVTRLVTPRDPGGSNSTSPFTWPGPSPVPTSTGPSLPPTKQMKWTKKQRGSDQRSSYSRKRQRLTETEQHEHRPEKGERRPVLSSLALTFRIFPTLNVLLLGWEKHHSDWRTGAGGEAQTGGHSSTPLGQPLGGGSSSPKAGLSRAKGPRGREDPARPNPPTQGRAQHPINVPAPLLAPASRPDHRLESSNRRAKPQNTHICVPESTAERREKQSL